MKLFLSKNTPDAEIVEYTIGEPEAQKEVVESNQVEVPVSEEQVPNEVTVEPTATEVPAAPAEETVSNVVETPVEEVQQENDLEPPVIGEDQQEVVSEATTEELPVAEEIKETTEEVVAEPETDDDIAFEYPESDEEVELNLPEDSVEEELKESDVKIDSINKEEDYTGLMDDFYKDPGIANLTDMIPKVISGYKNLEIELKNTKEELEIANAKVESQSKALNKNERARLTLASRLEKMVDENREKTVHNEELERKVNYLERINSSQADEIEELKNELAGKDKLLEYSSALEELVNSQESYDYDYEDNTYSRRVA